MEDAKRGNKGKKREEEGEKKKSAVVGGNVEEKRWVEKKAGNKSLMAVKAGNGVRDGGKGDGEDRRKNEGEREIRNDIVDNAAKEQYQVVGKRMENKEVNLQKFQRTTRRLWMDRAVSGMERILSVSKVHLKRKTSGRAVETLNKAILPGICLLDGATARNRSRPLRIQGHQKRLE